MAVRIVQQRRPGNPVFEGRSLILAQYIRAHRLARVVAITNNPHDVAEALAEHGIAACLIVPAKAAAENGAVEFARIEDDATFPSPCELAIIDVNPADLSCNEIEHLLSVARASMRLILIPQAPSSVLGPMLVESGFEPANSGELMLEGVETLVNPDFPAFLFLSDFPGDSREMKELVSWANCLVQLGSPGEIRHFGMMGAQPSRLQILGRFGQCDSNDFCALPADGFVIATSRATAQRLQQLPPARPTKLHWITANCGEFGPAEDCSELTELVSRDRLWEELQWKRSRKPILIPAPRNAASVRQITAILCAISATRRQAAGACN